MSCDVCQKMSEIAIQNHKCHCVVLNFPFVCPGFLLISSVRCEITETEEETQLAEAQLEEEQVQEIPAEPTHKVAEASGSEDVAVGAEDSPKLTKDEQIALTRDHYGRESPDALFGGMFPAWGVILIVLGAFFFVTLVLALVGHLACNLFKKKQSHQPLPTAEA